MSIVLSETDPRRPGCAAAPPARRRPTYEGLVRRGALGAYRTMVLSRRLDDKEIQLKNQNLIYFQISGAGHEAVLAAAGMHLRPGIRLVLSLLPRSRAVPRARHHAARDAASGRGRRGRSELGRPADAVALGHTALNIVSQSSPTGTQCLQAVGCAEAGRSTARRRDRDASRGFTTTRSSTSRSATARPAKASSGNR